MSPARAGSTRPGPAGTRRRRSSSPRTAARGTRSALGLRPTLWSGDVDSLAPGDARAARGGRASRSAASPTDKDESDTELALLAALARGADAIVVLGAFGGAAARPRARERRGCSPIPALAGRRRSLLDARSRDRSCVAPGPDGAPGRPPTPPAGSATSSRSLPLGDDAAGVTTSGLALPAARRAARRRAGPRPVERPRRRRTRP